MKSQLYGPIWRGAALGLMSAFAGLAASQLIAGVLGGGLSPVNAVGSEFIDIVPPWLKDLAIDLFGTNDKLALQAGIASVLALVSIGIGILAQRAQMAWAYGLTVVIGLVGVLAIRARPNADLGSVMATVIGTAVSCAVLWYLAPQSRAVAAASAGAADASLGEGDTVDPSTEVAAEWPASQPDRRAFVRSLGILGVGSFAAGYFGSWLTRRASIDSERASVVLSEASTGATTPGTVVDPSGFVIPDAANPANAGALPQPASVIGKVAGPTEIGVDGVTPFVVPNSDFYKIDTALSVPQISIDSWKLKIHGMVDNELTLTFQDLLDRPQIERDITLACVSNKVGGRLVGNATWQGVRLADVLAEAGIQPGATQMVSRSVDGWNCGSPTAQIMDGRDAMIAIGMNGEPLPADHGYPARLVVPGLYGYVSATKWLSDIELTTWEAFDGYWMSRGWAKIGPIKTMARIQRPDSARRAEPGPDGGVDIAGQAWAVHRGISKVEISIDGGEWLECELAGVPSDDTWRQWKYHWADPTEGEHTVAARAYDGNGEVQPEGPKAEAPDGSEGYHTINFRT